VSREAGRPWQDKLLRLPSFLSNAEHEPSPADLSDGFAMTGFFLSRHVFEPRGLPLPDARQSFVTAVLNACRTAREAS
jgi:DNA repair protein RecO (recombination protein O)